MIRLENNRVDKVFLGEYLKEIKQVVSRLEGLDDLNAYRLHFEKEFARFIGSRHAVAVNSGTDALQLILLALGIGPGDTVIVPDVTYISTALVVKYVGAEPIFVDVKKSDLTIDEGAIEKRIQENTKAIMAVHMFGMPCAMERLRTIAARRRLFLVEDACQALGSASFKKNVGSFGDLAAFSFSYYKPMSSLAGNGGMIAFGQDRYGSKIHNYLNLWKTDASVLDLGRKFNKISLTDLATAKVKFKYMKQVAASREKIKQCYERGLSGVKEIKIFSDPKGISSVRENYPILTEKRDKLFAYLSKKGIKTDLPYVPLHLCKMFQASGLSRGNFPVAERYYKHALHLPLYTFMKEEECRRVVETIGAFFGRSN